MSSMKSLKSGLFRTGHLLVGVDVMHQDGKAFNGLLD
jgi:hypothetical protein